MSQSSSDKIRQIEEIIQLQSEFEQLVQQETQMKQEIEKLKEDNDTFEDYIENLIERLQKFNPSAINQAISNKKN